MNTAGPDRWLQLWPRWSAGGDPLAAHRELASLYSQPHRHYHNLGHIAECLDEFDSAAGLAREPVSVELALWFHDAIYDTRAPDNEEQSAALARRCLEKSGCGSDRCASVTALILATKTHDPALHPDAPFMVDIDLSILGRPEPRFWQYETAIRREYDWVPREVFNAKRAEILERFLARPRLYATDEFFRRYEQTARRNLRRSIDQLRGQR